MYNELVAKKNLPAYKYEAGYVISIVFFSLTLLSFYLRGVFVSPKKHMYKYICCSPNCVGKVRFHFARYKYVILFIALKQLLTVLPLYYISRDKYASAHNQSITTRLIQNAQLADVLTGLSDDSVKRKCCFFKFKY